MIEREGERERRREREREREREMRTKNSAAFENQFLQSSHLVEINLSVKIVPQEILKALLKYCN